MQNVETRLAGYLLDCATLFGRRPAEGLMIDIALTQTERARSLAVSRKQIGRIVRVWSKYRILERPGSKLSITDPEPLRALTAGSRFGLAHRPKQV